MYCTNPIIDAQAFLQQYRASGLLYLPTGEVGSGPLSRGLSKETRIDIGVIKLSGRFHNE